MNDICIETGMKSKEMNCPVLRALDSFTGKWKLQIIWILSKGPMRYHQLRKALPMVTEKMLVQQLRQLEADAMVIRRQHPEVPPRVEYFLSEKSHSLLPIFESLSVWAEKFLPMEIASSIAEKSQESTQTTAPQTEI